MNVDHPSVRAFDAWLDSLAPHVKAVELGEIEDLLEAAARGDLEESGDEKTPIAPIVTDPDIYELRMVRMKHQLRFYHGEPPKYPQILLKLHRHIKTDSPPQQDEIDYAVERYHAGEGATHP